MAARFSPREKRVHLETSPGNRTARTYHGGAVIFLSYTQREAGTSAAAGDGIDWPDGWCWLLLGRRAAGEGRGGSNEGSR